MIYMPSLYRQMILLWQKFNGMLLYFGILYNNVYVGVASCQLSVLCDCL